MALSKVEIPWLNADPIKFGPFKKLGTLRELKRGDQIAKVFLIEVASDNTVLGLYKCVYEDKVLKKTALVHDPADTLETKLYRARANHLHGVAKFYGVWQDSSSYHFVSQFCELKEITEFTNFTEDGVSVLKEAKPFIKKLVQAVAELHVQGYAHLGLSDEASILVTREEGVPIPKLANLGEISSVTRQDIRWPTDAPGTLEFLPPELYGRDVADYDLTKVDGYQLAIRLLKIFFGYWLRPREFPAAWVIPSSRASTPWLFNLLAHMQWKDCVPDVQAASCLLVFLERMLHPDPDQRLTVTDALEHSYLNGQSSSHEAPTPSSTSAGASPSPSFSSTAAPTPSSTFASQDSSFLIEEPADQH